LFFTQYCNTPAALVALFDVNALSPPLSSEVSDAVELLLLLALFSP